MPATGHKPGILNHLSPIISWCNTTELLLSGDSKKTNKQLWVQACQRSKIKHTENETTGKGCGDKVKYKLLYTIFSAPLTSAS